MSDLDIPKVKKTKTSSFGIGKRESHDASTFYGRSLYEKNLFETNFTRPASEEEINNIKVPPVGSWVNKIYCQSSESMDFIPDNSIALAFTSPPYNVGKDYDKDLGLHEYLVFISRVAKEVLRVLRPGGRYVINIANLGRKPYIPIHAFFYNIHLSVGFLPMGEIIWKKAEGANNNCAWGSWMSAKAPRLRDIHEYLLVFAKQSFSRPDAGETNISPTEFMDATLSIWNIPPESAKRVRHPAPFPVELAERVIELYSYVGDAVIDPFVGSGSTCVAAVNKRRNYVGFDISSEYCDIARKRIEGKGKLYMPSEKTECSELSVAFGILGIKNPIDMPSDRIIQLFSGTLSPEKYDRFSKEFLNPKNTRSYLRLCDVGLQLRNSYPLFERITNLVWCGPQKQAKTDSGAQDLIVASIPISVKAGSNIIFNRSPVSIFVNIPQGKVTPDRSENWFLIADYQGFQKLYESIRNIRLDHLPQTVEDFERNAKSKEREELRDEINKLPEENRTKFEELYISMCCKVAKFSAQEFNKNYQESMNSTSRNAVMEYIVRYFFRLEFVEYILAGTTGAQKFAVKIPSLSNWKREWEITNIVAIPDLLRKQCVVNIIITYRNKRDRIDRTAKFHVEIRWSHGKFCGSPEAKLYKDFKWADIAFVESIL